LKDLPCRNDDIFVIIVLEFIVLDIIYELINEYYSQFCIIYHLLNINQQATFVSFNQIRNFSHFSLTSIKNGLIGIDFDSLYEKTCNDIETGPYTAGVGGGGEGARGATAHQRKLYLRFLKYHY
jgi:hypothetical protein